MRRFDANTGLETGRRSILFTLAALEASRSHERLVLAIAQQMGRWKPVSEGRRAAEDNVIRAHAQVSLGDHGLDRAVSRFANELLRDAEGDRENKVFREFFPEAPSEVVRMGLELEIERCERFAVVAGKRSLSERATAALAVVHTAMEAGRAALSARRAAFAQQAEAALDVESWKEATEAARQSVYVQLQAWALENGEDRTYAERFFSDARPARPKGRTAPKAPVGDEDEGGVI